MKSRRPAVTIPNEPLTFPLRQAARTWPGKAAVVAPESGGREYTYKWLEEASSRLAAALAGLGVSGGTRVGLWLPIGVACILSFYAIPRAGGGVVPMSTHDGQREVLHQVAQAHDVRAGDIFLNQPPFFHIYGMTVLMGSSVLAGATQVLASRWRPTDGFQVPPAAIERILAGHPDVRDAAVIGEPHPARGEVPVACVVRREGASVTPDELIDFAAEGSAKDKRLARVTIVDAIPCGPSGKIQRRALK